MIKLTEKVHVAASQISKIVVSDYDAKVNVHLADGDVIVVMADYGKTKFDKQEEIVASVVAEAPKT
ncbi:MULTISPECIES: hypothetical protein [unclassified Pseudomonas]|uniref:hypothetical protein n=1 Tax=unclassified Pseudomonas TaxID=196821 RepID=UPI000C86D080|nr:MULTISPECIES: hypothetical protein [unclassified Pseudomonas]PMV85511.1 hypothetical protein C1X51_30195 [Pseudomonas sp. FW306-2-2C-B10A]PMV87727.1 hypothetical protein C1X56_09825 [Pseudomonas sp. GW101-1A09]PMW01261.1 hypothetical protein C1X55_07110 [Pseudomonas sp. GW460-C8]PMW06582.1 hypothetical protein C1X50_08410 [Pseudomonas sp. MPR-TSA4]PMW07499.1 hypothetical protein C1X52_30300 [Pseudomonas sp. FW306-2-1A-C05A]